MITTGWLLALTLAMGPPVQGDLARDRAQKRQHDQRNGGEGA